jgi:sigma-B regulation protein RsbU (phosphoserine phosphatase)
MDDTRQVNRRLQQIYQQINHDLELARSVQQSLLPKAFPVVPGVRFGVHYRSCGRAGGDSHDVYRIDENHLGFFVADAMGYGLPASLLTIFMKNGIRAAQAEGGALSPDEALRRLNREMIEHKLLENNFVTMACGLLNFRDGALRFARAGHPPPLYFPACGEPASWSVTGPVLGVFESEFPVRTHTLNRGDKLLLFTDGIDASQFEQNEPGLPSLLVCAARHRDLPVRNFVDAIAGDLFRGQDVTDDVTLLALEMEELAQGK